MLKIDQSKFKDSYRNWEKKAWQTNPNLAKIFTIWLERTRSALAKHLRDPLDFDLVSIYIFISIWFSFMRINEFYYDL